MTGHLRAARLATGLVGAVALAACGGGGAAVRPETTSRPSTTTTTVPAPTTTTTTLPPLAGVGTLAVGVRTDAYVDPSRPTPPNRGAPGAPNRSMLTSVWYPAVGAPGAAVPNAPADTTHGPYPLIVFAHGFAVTPRTYAALLTQWASAGYVVVAPEIPLLNGDAPGGASHADYGAANITDLDFVLADALRRSAAPGDPLAGLIDANRVAVTGHSDGEVLAYALALEACCHDSRVKATIMMAGNLANAGVAPTATGVPALHIMNDHDQFDAYPASIAFDRQNLPAPKSLLTLVNAVHLPPYSDPADPHFSLVVHATVDFLDAILKGHPEAAAALQALVSGAPTLAMLESTPGP